MQVDNDIKISNDIDPNTNKSSLSVNIPFVNFLRFLNMKKSLDKIRAAGECRTKDTIFVFDKSFNRLIAIYPLISIEDWYGFGHLRDDIKTKLTQIRFRENTRYQVIVLTQVERFRGLMNNERVYQYGSRLYHVTMKTGPNNLHVGTEDQFFNPKAYKIYIPLVSYKKQMYPVKITGKFPNSHKILPIIEAHLKHKKEDNNDADR